MTALPVEVEHADRRRFPIQPALDLAHRHGVSHKHIRQAGINLPRAIRAGSVNGDQADRLAGILHYHPYEIWGDSWYQENDTSPVSTSNPHRNRSRNPQATASSVDTDTGTSSPPPAGKESVMHTPTRPQP